MRTPKIYGNSNQQKRISDELRQLKQMSKSLRPQAVRALLKQHAAQRPGIKPVLPPAAKPSTPIAA